MASVMDEHWGERRAAERARRQSRIGLWIVFGAVAAVTGVPFVRGFVDGWLDRPHRTAAAAWDQPVSTLIFVAVALSGAWLAWRAADEVQRRRITTNLAVIGGASIVLRPVLEGLQPVLALADPFYAAWLLSIVTGAVVMALQPRP